MKPLPLPLALAIALSYLAYASTAAFTATSVALLVAAGVAVALRGRIPVPRLVLIPAALVLGLVIFSNLPQQARGATFLLATAYGIGLFLAIITVMLVVRPGTDGEHQGTVFMGMMLMLIAGSTTAVFPYALILGVQGLLLAIGLRTFGPSPARVRRVRDMDEPRGMAPSLKWSIAAYLVVVTGALVVAVGLVSSEHLVNRLLMFTDSGGYQYPQRASLREILDGRDNGRVLARVFSSNPAMYLAGRCYLKYDRATWEATLPDESVAPLDEARVKGMAFDGTLYPMARPTPPDEVRPVIVDRLELAVELHGTFFTPRDGVVLGARVPSLSRDMADIYYMPGDSPGYYGEYVVGRGRVDADARPLSDAVKQQCLQIPDKEREFLAPLAAQAVGGAADDLQAARNVERFLQTTYTYGRGYHLPPGEPLHGFLAQHIPAHCELFATSMVMMLRQRGIPSRYITGFVVVERNEAGDYSVIRGEHAHAWVEAWIPNLGWVQFDPTPAGGRPQPSASRSSQWLDLLMHKMQQLRAISWRSLLNGALTGAQRLGAWLIEKWWRVGVLLLLFFGEALFRRADAPGRRWWRRWRSAGARTTTVDDPLLDGMLGALARFDALMERAGMARPPARTLREHGRALAEQQDELRGVAVEFLETYERVRYGQPRPSADDVDALRALCDRLEALAPDAGKKR